MKKFIPQSQRHKVIKNPIVIPAAAASAQSPMTVVPVPASLAGAENRVAALICRRTVSDTVAHVYLGRTYAFTSDAPQSFAGLGKVRGFALTGQLVAWAAGPAIENRPPNSIQILDLATIVVKLVGVDRIMPDVSDFDALADTTLLFCENEILSVARAAMQPDGSYALTVLPGRFGTPTNGYFRPGDTVWIVSRARLNFFGHPIFAAGNTAKFKITVGKQPLANAIPFEIQL
jgi:hypothetical protein